MNAGCEKLKIAPEGCQLVLEEDGTDVDEDVDISRHAHSTFILLGKDECWSSSSSASTTAASVPEPIRAPSAPTGRAETASQNTSKRLENIFSCFTAVRTIDLNESFTCFIAAQKHAYFNRLICVQKFNTCLFSVLAKWLTL